MGVGFGCNLSEALEGLTPLLGLLLKPRPKKEKRCLTEVFVLSHGLQVRVQSVRALLRLSTKNWADAFPRKRRPSWMAAVTAARSGSSFSASSSRATTRGAAASTVKFWSRDSFLSASRASLPSSPFMMLSILGQRVLSPSGKPNLSTHDLLVALSTGFGRQKVVSRKAFVAEDTSKVRAFLALVSCSSSLSTSSERVGSSLAGLLASGGGTQEG